MTGAICGGYGVLERRIRDCPTENAPRRMLGEFAAYYGWTITCLGCGDRWMDGERGERPFARGWRQESIARAWVATADGTRFGAALVLFGRAFSWGVEPDEDYS